MKNLKFVFISFSILLMSCHKHNEATNADITLIEPMEGDTLLFGEELHAEGTIVGDGELHGYSLNMINQTTGETLLTKATSDHAETYSFHEHWVNSVTDTSNVKIIVEVELNHDGDMTSKEINVVCLPQ
ncbi:MAG TPA: hypothetical protein DEF82_01065 [Crocinitomicaceae bacterium]|nr:hypothetical protein [Flavobacteriales bacterium]HBW85370.1 hypothetical protein [Crocinitomicaceae bacterium]